MLMRKGGMSHKRFKITFTITADGVMLCPHTLLCGLKNKPVVPIGILVDVNQTGMWNDFTRNVHLNLAKSKILEKHNVFVTIVSPNMTNILQPLDVAINCSYQAFL
jgi:hypothetical protein